PVVDAPPTPPPPAPEEPPDPRVGLEPGWRDAGQAAWNLEPIAHVDRPEGFYDPNALGNILLANSDMAFRDELLFMGSFHGFNIYDISNPRMPRLRTSFVCPGGQGDLSVYGDLLFMSVEMPNGRVDCGTTPPSEPVSPERFRGVRVFDISDLDEPVQVATVQTCRGSHTHTLVTDPDDDENVYIYVQGTSSVRPAAELAGCSGLSPEEDPSTALFRIEIIRVPLDSPEDARVINTPRIFADVATGEIAGLWPGGTHGLGSQSTATTDQCHDITAYPAMELAAGACSGNGILLDISEPDEPVRLDEVVDPNFAYWHSATFNNAATTVLFTDEWGGGVAPRCLASDDPRWGADAIFRLDDGELSLAGYYKLPAAQTELENCVAHNGSLVPVPGRDIMVQAWYQGGVSVFDFTDPEKPYEIAFFDRGPMSADELLLSGFWSTYWYNGHIYGSEIGRGLDVFTLEPSEHLTRNELEAARLIELDRFNAQTQPHIEWPPSFVVARALLDQLARGSDVVPPGDVAELATRLDRVEAQAGAEQR
ncbi:MAG: LVIVD repeat-containing protein, partial [Longimicrobiales bacterium]